MITIHIYIYMNKAPNAYIIRSIVLVSFACDGRCVFYSILLPFIYSMCVCVCISFAVYFFFVHFVCMFRLSSYFYFSNKIKIRIYRVPTSIRLLAYAMEYLFFSRVFLPSLLLLLLLLLLFVDIFFRNFLPCTALE